jgi:hypothetical protein
MAAALAAASLFDDVPPMVVAPPPKRAAQFHSSPSTRLGLADPEATKGQAWQGPFQLNLQHFSPVSANSAKTLSAAIAGQSRGM